MEFKYRTLKEELGYRGPELRTGFVAERTGLAGDAAAVFIGPCRVATGDLVDLDDARAGETIVAARMLHVIVEHPGADLTSTVLRQRIMVAILCDILRGHGVTAERSGDDVFVDGRKLTVSIAAPGPAGCAIHLGINVDPDGAPVPAVGLAELGVNEAHLGEELMTAYKREIESAAYAENKVRPIE